MTWARPKEGVIKINVDVAVSKEVKTIGTGAIAWGNDGVVLGIMLTVRKGIISSRIAETVAIRDGLNMGIALNHTKVIIESDVESIVESCATPKDSASDVAVLVKLSGEGSWRSTGTVPGNSQNILFNAFLNGANHWLAFGFGCLNFFVVSTLGLSNFGSN